MSPLTLHLEYFGPYRDTTIDFTKFAATPLFLISGKTGSGKTTIFDGMSYALFDQTSGTDREPKSMRSDFATMADVTRVTFNFTHRNRRYEIIREPNQTLAKKRGSGTTDVASKVTLTVFQNGNEVEQLTKTGQVKDYLQTLLQMDGKQFAQIVLLPQGQFRRFLVAPSDEKATVLEQLFNTEIFAKWTTELREQAKQDALNNQAAAESLSRLQEQLQWTETNEPTAQAALEQRQTTTLLDLMATQQGESHQAIQTLTDQVTGAQERVEQLTRRDTQEAQLVKDQAALQQVKATQQALASREPEMQQVQSDINELEWGQQVQPKWLEEQEATSARTRRQQALATAQQELVVAEAGKTQAIGDQKALEPVEQRVQAAQSEWDRMQRLQPIYHELAQRTTDLTSQRQALLTDQNKVNRLKQAIADSEHQQEQFQSILEQQAVVNEQAQKLSERGAVLKDCERQLTVLQTGDQALRTLMAQGDSLQEQLVQAQTAAEQLAQQAEKVNQAFIRDQIQQLTRQLKPGTPCPVCGSTEHPHPAVITAEPEVTQQAVDEAKTAAAAGDKQVTALTLDGEQNHSQLLEQRKTQASGLCQLAKVLGIDEPADLSGVDEALKRQAEAQRAALTANHDKQNDLDQAQEASKQLVTKLAEQRQGLDVAQQALQEIQRQVDRLETTIQGQRDQLPTDAPTLTAFTERGQQLQTQLKADRDQLDQAAAAIVTAEQRLAGAKTRVQTATTEVAQSDRRWQEAQTTLMAELNQHFDVVNETTKDHVADLLRRLSGLAAKRQTIQDFQSQQERLATQLDDLQRRTAGQATPDREQTQAQLKQAQQQVTTLQDQRHGQQTRWQQNDRLVHQIADQVARRAEALQRTQSLTELSGVVTGDGTSGHLGLERYVLQTYLRQILTVGNKRLRQLTNGRYQFVIDDSQASSKKRSGLEINVYDDHVGEQRSVHTLSGGESFMASLALALALGEVIQSTTGSVEVDALFIDEGFGSLDEEALMTALESLETIEGQHRMIGIISHVSELRDQVANQLQVISNGNGESTIAYQSDN
ncbi:AAA family ATPase [Levilactobacillus tangyuanensis]|uniref:AAA family ATPase n=1 Tax=Levilactobacillus tangyuanensis TaxID=2486021 RepID=UPI000F7A0909|nr:SMC family ATPase [Levilactobacillus tangyuanensis]